MCVTIEDATEFYESRFPRPELYTGTDMKKKCDSLRQRETWEKGRQYFCLGVAWKIKNDADARDRDGE